ncbi:MAG: Gfo/Idh/MocA family oxidoreductase [Planctomycetota bacterium]
MPRKKSALTRRQFVQGSALGAAAMALPSWKSFQRLGANEEIRVGVVGFNSRGKSHINGLHRLDGVRVTALCDVDRNVLNAGVQEFEKRGEKVAAVTDVRRLLDRDDIDVIATATPNHWHALIAIWACQSGKDVYLEKPVSHNVWEGRQIVNAARKYGRIVQTGTQCRSSQAIAEAIQWIQSGQLGKIQVARGLCYKPRKSIGKVSGPQSVPAHIDYDLWLGPAPKQPLWRKSLHYDWHWDFATGNGDLGNQGIHQMDICRWALGVQELSPRVMSVGGRFAYADDANTPNTQYVYHDYEGAPLIFEVRGLPKDLDQQNGRWEMDNYKGARIGCIIHCEGGELRVPSYSTAIALDKDGKEVKKWNGAQDHFANFIDAVRSRKKEDLTADILEGHLSSALCHTGNISYMLGGQKSPEECREAVKGNPESLETYERMAAHLEANGVDLKSSPATFGPWLEMDPKTERFEDNEWANALLRRNYRAPFVVSDES